MYESILINLFVFLNLEEIKMEQARIFKIDETLILI